MENTLTFFGTDPKMLGLATVGGLASLAFLLWQLIRFFYRKRVLLAKGVYAYKRKKLLREILHFKVSVVRKEARRSELIVAREELRRVSSSFTWLLTDVTLALSNILFYLRDMQANSINWYAAVLLCFGAIVDSFQIRRHLKRAWLMIDWANYPDVGRTELVTRARRLRKRKYG